MKTPSIKSRQTGCAPTFARRVACYFSAICLSLIVSPAAVAALPWETADEIVSPSGSEGITADSTGNVFASGWYKDATGRNHAMVTKSSDGGVSWQTAADFPSVNDAAAPNGSMATFSAITSGDVSGDGTHLVAAGRIKRVPFGNTFTGQWLIVRSKDAGATWQTVDEYSHPTYSQLSGETVPSGVAVDGSGNIYVAGLAEEKIVTVNRKTTTTKTVRHWLIRKGIPTAGGMSWTTVGDFPYTGSNDAEHANHFPGGVACVGNDVYVVGGNGGSWVVRKSGNGGATWQIVDNFRLDTSGNSRAFGIAADSQGNLFVAGEGRQTVTTGKGKSATTVTHYHWIVRQGTGAGTNWATVDQYQYPVAGGRAGAYAVTVDGNDDIHVTGYGWSAPTSTRWITRQRSVATGLWSSTDDFSAVSGGYAEGTALAADPSGNVFAAGVTTYPPDANYGWLVRRNSATPRADVWTSRPGEGTVPGGRSYHSTVWTGSEMIVWGGVGPKNTGDRYNPVTNTWTPVSTVGAPSGRYYHSAIWTGSEMIVWGGFRVGGNFGDGARYNPATDTWTPVSTVGAPAARRDHTAVWTGSEMIVWGGSSASSTVGGRYNPATDTWVTMSVTGVPDGREYHQAVWTGSEMIVWGGTLLWNNGYTYLNTGGRYHPASDSWVPTSTTGAPATRSAHSMVWTGTEMIVWGGHNNTSRFGDGGRYDPVSNSWNEVMSTAGPPSPRSWHSGVWTGTEMIVWGGYDGSTDLNTGSRYNPEANHWTAMTTFGAPIPSQNRAHSLVWTGTEIIYRIPMSGDVHLIYRYFAD